MPNKRNSENKKYRKRKKKNSPKTRRTGKPIREVIKNGCGVR